MSRTMYEHFYSVDLDKPLRRHNVGLLATYDNKANRFGAKLERDGAEVDATGYSVHGYFIRPSEETVLIEGVASGNMVHVDLPANCYYYDGAFTLSIKIGNDDFEQTVLICDGRIGQTRTDAFVDNERKIPSIAEIIAKMEAVDAATASANTASQNANTAAENASKEAKKATDAATAANTATKNANTATSEANSAAQTATSAAESANTAAGSANNAAQAANAAAWTANTAAGEATNAAKTASDAAEAANNAARSATSAGQEATTAAQSANAAKQAADTATSSANSAASNATTAAGNATSAAEAATNVANEIREARENGELDGVGIESIATSRTPNENGEVDVTIFLTDGRNFKYTTLATVTTDSITAALGFTPANDETVSTISEGKIDVINIAEKYDVDKTGSADCSALINQAIAEATAGDTLYLPNGTYKLDSTVIVNKKINLKFEGTFKYTGTEFAFLFKNFSYSKAEVNTIQAKNGSCIKLFSDWNTEKNFIQYSRFCFTSLESRKKTDTDNGGYCFFVEPVNGGWINENRFTGGQMNGGYGVYVDCNGSNAFNGNLFDSCGVENISIGFYLANNCRNNMIYRCRHSESLEKFLTTVGVCTALKIFSNSPFKVSENDISESTTGLIIASMMDESGTLCDTKANFVRGTIVCEKHNNTKYLSTEPAGVFDMTNLLGYEDEYKDFVVGGLCTGVKLNKKYGYAGGINEFFVKFTKDNTGAFPIVDCDGNELTYVVPQASGSVVRFNWFSETGWQYNYEFSDATQIKELIKLSDYVRNGDAVKTVNQMTPDENGNIEIVVVNEEPEVVGSIEECADTSKKYVLPDGYIYAYRKRFIAGGTTPNFTNQLPISLSPALDGSVYEDVGYKLGTRLDSGDGAVVEKAQTDSFAVYTTGLIPVKIGDVIRVNRIGVHTTAMGSGNPSLRIYRETLSYNAPIHVNNLTVVTAGGGKYTLEGEYGNGIISDLEVHVNAATLDWVANAAIGYASFTILTTTPPEDVIITVNEEITYTVTEDRYEWSWENTGEPYTKPDYLGMIADLEARIEALENAK